jgi:hypothetical protein
VTHFLAHTFAHSHFLYLPAPTLTCSFTHMHSRSLTHLHSDFSSLVLTLLVLAVTCTRTLFTCAHTPCPCSHLHAHSLHLCSHSLSLHSPARALTVLRPHRTARLLFHPSSSTRVSCGRDLLGRLLTNSFTHATSQPSLAHQLFCSHNQSASLNALAPPYPPPPYMYVQLYSCISLFFSISIYESLSHTRTLAHPR